VANTGTVLPLLSPITSAQEASVATAARELLQAR
jgi:hypothetical protein